MTVKKREKRGQAALTVEREKSSLSPYGRTFAPGGTWIEVSLERILRNLERVREKAGPSVQVMAVVKANAYGHGIVPVSRALEEKVDFLGISSIKEASLLREQGITAPLFVFGRIFPDEIAPALGKNLILTVSGLEEAKMISEAATRFSSPQPSPRLTGRGKGEGVKVHVKVDTGMGRLGIPSSRAFSEIVTLASLPGIQLDGIYTHFPTAERYPDFFTEKQLSHFEKLIQDLDKRGISFRFRHAANSAAAIRFRSPWLNLVRPGLALYGLYPDPSLEEEIALEPALSIKSRIVFLKSVSTGDSVGYGREFMATGPTTIGVLPMGYAHGYPFQLSGKAEVLYRGKRFRVAGRVCMDSMMIDFGSSTPVHIGDEVILLGSYGEERITAEALASIAHTIPYEIVTRLDPGLPRFYR